ncbi:response regulator receiver protein [Pseudorhodobacter antarcticus]|jgi:CheY-like chemotaxis protein|uniref:Response regulator receiver protein n=1 Tax=Pseudorhodobacter antarcticus TaxID=1077947 RepID=A0A1H8LYT8_9RHOB|nr:response regulator [Pseudorhodobacter antarcticus]SEO10283.1 response regulator receiver protein [Pseudorhodobacter antarcticus]
MPPPVSHALPEGPGFAQTLHRAALPLAGITLLVVEDSRFASEALRLLCQRSGARMRRAETLATARQHLAVYRPDVVLVDLGLPDGNGVDLIREVTRNRAGETLVLATSGDPDGWSAALRAGAAGFIEKPLDSLVQFQAVILSHLHGIPRAAPGPDDTPIHPDRQALQDDLVHAAALLAQEQGRANGGKGTETCAGTWTETGTDGGRYLTDFVAGIARSANDTALASAAVNARRSASAMAGLGTLLSQRIGRGTDAFARPFADPPDKIP